VQSYQHLQNNITDAESAETTAGASLLVTDHEHTLTNKKVFLPQLVFAPPTTAPT